MGRFWLSLILLLSPSALAEVRLAPLFVDGAVLQRDRPVAVWGWADAGQTVTVSFRGHTVTATPDGSGRWRVRLPATAASAEPADLLVSAGSETRTVRDVVVGEVWLCSGQSNMQWTVKQSANADREIAAGTFPLIRHFRVPQEHATEPRETTGPAKWMAASPQTVGSFSAVAYYFARDLHRELNVPVGLINTSWGGKMIEVFMSPEALASRPEFGKVFRRWEEEQAALPAKLPEYRRKLAEWEAERDAAARSGQPFKKTRPTDPQWVVDQHRPSCVYNGLVHPAMPYGIRGVIWYQGEHNISRPEEYELQLTTMITDWREKFGQGDFPFYFAQLSSFEAPLDKSRDGFARLREAQLRATALTNTGMAVTFDIGTPNNVHPPNKQDVGARLARIAKAKTYGIDVEWSGPLLRSATREQGGIRLRFDHADGLTLRFAPASSFEVAGADGKFTPVEARVEGRDVLLPLPAGGEIVTVRYAWGNAPAATLFNGDGLPASPFRHSFPK